MKKLILAGIVAALPALAGCHYHGRAYHGYSHSYSGPDIYVTHSHGPNCGHTYSHGVWIDTRPTVVYSSSYYGRGFGYWGTSRSTVIIGPHHSGHGRHHGHGHYGHRRYR